MNYHWFISLLGTSETRVLGTAALHTVTTSHEVWSLGDYFKSGEEAHRAEQEVHQDQRREPSDCVCVVCAPQIGHRHVVDATLQEKACSLASLLISVTHKGLVTCVRKIGGGSLDPDSIFEMTEVGRWWTTKIRTYMMFLNTMQFWLVSVIHFTWETF